MKTSEQTVRRGLPQLGRGAAFVGVAGAFAVTMLGTTLPTPLYPIYQQQIGFSKLMVTVIYAAYAAGVIVALLLFGELSDQVGRRRLLLPGLGLAAVSSLVFLLADGLAPLFGGGSSPACRPGSSPARQPRPWSTSLRKTSEAAPRWLPPRSTSAVLAWGRWSPGALPSWHRLRCGFPSPFTWVCSSRRRL